MTDRAGPNQGRTLTELRLGNFKSVQHAVVTLRPLTVVIGANSSGKSTLFQGLLLLAQTARSEVNIPRVELNGELVSLGYLETLRRASVDKVDKLADISVGVTAEFPPSRRNRIFWGGDESEDLSKAIWSGSVDLSFGSGAPDQTVMAPVTTMRLTASTSDGRSLGGLNLKRRHPPYPGLTPEDVIAIDQPFVANPTEPTFELAGTLTGSDFKPTRVEGLRLRGIRIDAAFERGSASSILANVFTSLLPRFGWYADEPLQPANEEIDERLLLDNAASILRQWYQLPAGRRSNLPEMIYREQQSSATFTARALEYVAENRQRLTRLLSRRLGPLDKTKLLTNVSDRVLRPAATVTDGVWRALMDVRHLGGLRAAPQPLYPTSSRALRGDLGRNGEFTAAVLYALRDHRVVSFDQAGSHTTKTLQDAVKWWASRLELFDDVASHHRGALGIDIAVRQAGLEAEVDITAVGLGVSQMLPVLVRCLLSDPGETVLLEQPELHLHPASQQRLADFLIACVRSGRQLIVESHSEHLVNRYDVVPAWQVKHLGAVISTHYVKADAIDAGVKVAKANRPSQLVIHRADGTIEDERTYDDDPYPPRG